VSGTKCYSSPRKRRITIFDEVYGLFDDDIHFAFLLIMKFEEMRFMMHGLSFCLRHSTCHYYLSLSFIALLVDTNIYRSLRELDCLENRFSSVTFGEVLYASVLC
jgi:hypothetical protein